jgi:hypothetical protein
MSFNKGAIKKYWIWKYSLLGIERVSRVINTKIFGVL